MVDYHPVKSKRRQECRFFALSPSVVIFLGDWSRGLKTVPRVSLKCSCLHGLLCSALLNAQYLLQVVSTVLFGFTNDQNAIDVRQNKICDYSSGVDKCLKCLDRVAQTKLHFWEPTLRKGVSALVRVISVSDVMKWWNAHVKNYSKAPERICGCPWCIDRYF